MKHAFLIIAHNNFEVLKRQLGILDNKNSTFFIHIDQRATVDKTDLLSHVKKAKVIFVKRKKIIWGGYSQIDCELRLINEAVMGNFDYYHLLSGVDMPIKPFYEIDRFFERNNGKEFIHFDGEEVDYITRQRISLYHLFQRNIGILRYINIFFIKCQQFCSLDRLRDETLVVRKGANWFSITNNLAKYVVNKKKKISKLFRFSLCADEMFLQTIIYNSNFRINLFDQELRNDYQSCMRYIDWKRGKRSIIRRI